MRPLHHALSWLAAAALTGEAAAQGTQLQPVDARITDAAIQADHQAYDALQGRIRTLNDGGRRVADYGLAKAQCWLDVSFHEYTRNDRGPFPQAALTESEKLVVRMEQGQAPGWDTPLVGEAVRLRPDLWARAEALRGSAGWRCAQARTACAEVELVHAGNEDAQLGWRHAKPYVQIAEDQLATAEAQAQACEPPPAPAVARAVPALVPSAPPAPPIPAAPPPTQERVMVTQVLFDFDRSGERDVRPFSVVQLEDMVRRARDEGLDITAVQLSGHADRLNGTGTADYNQRLSERRVQTVRDMLAALGVPASLVQTRASGDAQPVTGCENRFRSQAELRECLLPNRRVEVTMSLRRR